MLKCLLDLNNKWFSSVRECDSFPLVSCNYVSRAGPSSLNFTGILYLFKNVFAVVVVVVVVVVFSVQAEYPYFSADFPLPVNVIVSPWFSAMFCHAGPSSLNFTGILFYIKMFCCCCFFFVQAEYRYFSANFRLATLKNTQK